MSTYARPKPSLLRSLRSPHLILQVFDLLSSKDLSTKYPLFSTIYSICYEGAPIDTIIDGLYIPNGMNGTKIESVEEIRGDVKDEGGKLA